MSADNRDLYDPEGFYFDDEVEKRHHRIRTGYDSHGMYWVSCDCGQWGTSPVYNSSVEARTAGQDHLNVVRS